MPDKLLKDLLWVYIVATALAMAYVYGFVVKANGDNVEHLHSSWLIWQGFVPYRDFFQHHNPLLWYLSAPLVAALINQFAIFSVFNVISVAALCIMIYFQCKIMLLSGTGRLAVLFLAACEISSYSILWAMDYRPDTYMYLCWFIGFYFLLRYKNTPELWLLVISFLCFFMSFLFTQKVLFNLVVPGGAVIYWLLSGRISLRDFALASLLPALLLLLLAAYFYNNDALYVYWQANFPFNAYIPNIFYNNRITFPPREYYEFCIFIPLGAIASVYFIIKGNCIERMIGLMFAEETLLRLFYFSAFLHYSIFWLVLGMMSSIMFLNKISRAKALFAALGIVYLLFSLGYIYIMTYTKELKSHAYMDGHELAFYNLTPCDYAINGYYAVYNLKARDAGYYWVLLGQIDVLGEKSGIARRDNLNELIRTKKPKIISGGIYWDTYWEQRGKRIMAHAIDPDLLDIYYEPSGVGDIFILKPQYQKHDCQYNGKSWEYAD